MFSAFSAIRSSNAAYAPARPPVAVFVGGTSGIGQAMAEALGRYTQGRAHIVLVGRNQAAAENILESLPRNSTSKSEEYTHEFVYCDVSLMRNVHAVTRDLRTRYPKINFLILSPGFLSMKGRDETEEGIDKKLAANYYARWRFISDLMPSLEKAAQEGEDAKVMSVLAAGKGGQIDMQDLGLKKTYSVTNAGLATPTYNDLMMEEFALRNPSISFIHAYPGFVRTPIMKSSDSALLRTLATPTIGLLYPFTTGVEDCAEYMWHALFNSSARGPGSVGIKNAYRTGSRGENLERKRYYGDETQRRKLWEHTWQAVQVD
ncbi:hypothetical protein AMATHDRAFT_146712 [Amanita thiersii Skay4041]|uniref:Ketoreductase (KR) domain-containing protein n=1 Tax=Amanita thiersii Skay4041 TaxID=703135 RepID=A0A2A9NIF2_9AGAR|nr:hypothetical protein AMATHDRAFT_146712 [Amanita thiersii Skay4041]